jgi:RNA polymerase sigma factor (sigma-70 family)
VDGDSINPVIDLFRRAAQLDEQAARSDSELLTAFVRRKDDVAFEALVRRHGPMVWSVCRRVLNGHHDAEDAFQATFVVLAHKASSVKPPEAVANWLHGVAYRVSLKLRTTTGKRNMREKQMTTMPEREPAAHDPWHDLKPLIDQELGGLPDRYRLPIILCDLEGKTIQEVVHQLGWPQGTVAGRLARGRKLLARRLANRGVALAAGSLAAVLAHAQPGAAAEVPATAIRIVVEAASLIAAGQTVGVVSIRVAALVQGMLRALVLQKLKMAMVVLAMLALAALGGGFAGYRAVANQAHQQTPINDVQPNVAQAPQDKPQPGSADNGKPSEGSKPARTALIQHKPFSDDDLAKLDAPEEVEVLRLRGTHGYGSDTVTDAGMAHIVRFKNLRVLAAGALWLSDRSLDAISKLDKLEELELDSNKIAGTGLDRLARLKNLRKLNLNFNPLQPDTLAALLALRGLTQLDLYSSVRGVDDTLLRRLSALEKLAILKLPENFAGTTDKGLEAIARLKNLKTFSLMRTKNVTDAGLAHLAALTKLESLDLRELPSVTPRGMEVLGKLTNLRWLHIAEVPMDDAALRALAPLKHLQDLLVWNVANDRVDLDVLGELTSLRRFRTNQTVSSSAIRAMAKLDQLESITDELYEITDEDLKFLARAPKLHTLVLASEQVTAAALPSLAKMTSLRQLYVTEKVRIEPEQLAELGKTSLTRCRISRFRPPYAVYYQPPRDNTRGASMRDPAPPPPPRP